MDQLLLMWNVYCASAGVVILMVTLAFIVRKWRTLLGAMLLCTTYLTVYLFQPDLATPVLILIGTVIGMVIGWKVARREKTWSLAVVMSHPFALVKHADTLASQLPQTGCVLLTIRYANIAYWRDAMFYVAVVEAKGTKRGHLVRDTIAQFPGIVTVSDAVSSTLAEWLESIDRTLLNHVIECRRQGCEFRQAAEAQWRQDFISYGLPTTTIEGVGWERLATYLHDVPACHIEGRIAGAHLEPDGQRFLYGRRIDLTKSVPGPRAVESLGRLLRDLDHGVVVDWDGLRVLPNRQEHCDSNGKRFAYVLLKREHPPFFEEVEIIIREQ